MSIDSLSPQPLLCSAFFFFHKTHQLSVFKNDTILTVLSMWCGWEKMMHKLTNQGEIQVISENSIRLFRTLDSGKAPYIQIPKEIETLNRQQCKVTCKGHSKGSSQRLEAVWKDTPHGSQCGNIHTEQAESTCTTSFLLPGTPPGVLTWY